MPDILGAVDSLRLAPQHRLIDHGFIRGCIHMGQQRVELPRPQDLAAGQFRADRIGKVAQRVHLFRVGLVMNPKDAGATGFCQRLGCRDIGGDHIVLDQPLGLALCALDNRLRHAVLVKKHASFLEVQRQRLARLSGCIQGLPGAEQVGKDGVINVDGGLVMPALMPGLYLIIGQARRRADQGPLKPVRDHLAAVIKGDFGHHRCTRFLRAQRAQIVRQGLRKHWHNTVWQIDRIAAPFCLAVKRGARADIMRHIGDRHPNHPAAGITRFGQHSIVKIACVGAVNGDEGQVTKIDPPFRRRHLHPACFGNRSLVEIMRDFELGKGQCGKGPRGTGRTHVLDDTRCLAEIPAARQKFCLNKISVAAGNVAVLFQHDGVAGTACRLLQDESATSGDNGAEQASLNRLQNADDLALIACATYPAQSCQHLLASARRTAAPTLRKEPDRGWGAVNLDRGNRQQGSVTIDLADDDHGDVRQGVGCGDLATGLPGDGAAFGQRFQATTKRCAEFLRQVKGPRHLLDRRRSLAPVNEFKNGLIRGKTVILAHEAAFLAAAFLAPAFLAPAFFAVFFLAAPFLAAPFLAVPPPFAAFAARSSMA